MATFHRVFSKTCPAASALNQLGDVDPLWLIWTPPPFKTYFFQFSLPREFTLLSYKNYFSRIL